METFFFLLPLLNGEPLPVDIFYIPSSIPLGPSLKNMVVQISDKYGGFLTILYFLGSNTSQLG